MPIEPIAFNSGLRTSVTTLPDGRVFAVYISNPPIVQAAAAGPGDGTGGGDTGGGGGGDAGTPAYIRGQFLNANGAPIGPEIDLGSSSSISQLIVTALAGGGFVIAYARTYASNTKSEIYSRVLDAAGNPLSGTITEWTGVASYQHVSVSSFGTGNGYVVSSALSGAGNALVSKIYSAPGQLLSTTTWADQDFRHTASVGFSNGGSVSAGLVVAAEGYRIDAVVRFNNGATQRVTLATDVHNGSISIASGPNYPDGFVMAAHANNSIQVAYYGRNGGLITKYNVPVGLNDQILNPVVTVGLNGTAVVAWVEKYGASQVVKVQSVDRIGTVDAITVDTMPSNLGGTDLSISTLGDGRTIITYRDKDAATLRIFSEGEIHDFRVAPVDLRGTSGNDHYVGTAWDDVFHAKGAARSKAAAATIRSITATPVLFWRTSGWMGPIQEVCYLITTS
jgi:hypothetical protein